jgi:hypothetical protein
MTRKGLVDGKFRHAAPTRAIAWAYYPRWLQDRSDLRKARPGRRGYHTAGAGAGLSP